MPVVRKKASTAFSCGGSPLPAPRPDCGYWIVPDPPKPQICSWTPILDMPPLRGDEIDWLRSAAIDVIEAMKESGADKRDVQHEFEKCVQILEKLERLQPRQNGSGMI